MASFASYATTCGARKHAWTKMHLHLSYQVNSIELEKKAIHHNLNGKYRKLEVV